MIKRSLLCATNMKALLKFSSITMLLLILIALVLFFAVGQSIFSNKGSSLTFVNNSGQTLQSATISVAGKSCGVKALQAGGEMQCYFENLHDSSYSVSVKLENGTSHAAESLGYVTGGMNFIDTITINHSGKINLDSSPST